MRRGISVVNRSYLIPKEVGRMRPTRWAQARGFTLIELLIVVAIIAILALIAVPNFLEAQVRAKVSRSRNDMRALSVAEEAYHVDWNSYTNHAGGADLGGDYGLRGWRQLTTPVAYITSIPWDPFGEARHPVGTMRWGRVLYELGSGAAGIGSAGTPDSPEQGFPSNTWQMSGHGPDKYDDTVTVSNAPDRAWSWNEARYPWVDIPPNDPAAVSEALSLLYDPTNGTVSRGNILRFGGMKPGGRIFDVLFANASGK